MGKANRERRRIKAKARQRASAAGSAAGGGGTDSEALFGWGAFGGFGRPTPPPSVEDQVVALVGAALSTLDAQDTAALDQVADRLSTGAATDWRPTVERVLHSTLTETISRLWRHGWQPADLLRFAARRWKTPHLQLLHATMASELRGYAEATIDPRWAAQLAEGHVQVWWPSEVTALQACARSHPGGWPDFVIYALELLHGLNCLPVLEELGPRPGTATAASPGPSHAVDERILARVRALLAKAESTTYPAEAETFTAGAQALMARHSIDHALLAAAGRAPSDRPTGRRLGIDNPYEAPKATLLDAVASANRCRAVWTKNLGYTTVVGYPTDLDTVEVLFTSLLVQATAAMAAEGSRADRAGRSRTRTFRQSFLLSYAHRIRERLTQTTEEQTTAAAAEPGGSNLLPVLAARTEVVDETVEQMFPQLTRSRVGSAWDHEGWASGRAAADLASLTPATPVTG